MYMLEVAYAICTLQLLKLTFTTFFKVKKDDQHEKINTSNH